MAGSGHTAPGLRRSDSSLSPEETALLATIAEELHDMRRVQAYGQEEDLKEALGKVINRVEELSEKLSKMFKTQLELGTALKLARSNLQLALSNNEMLEDALRRESVTCSKDIGWRRGNYSTSRPVSRQGHRVSTEREHDKERPPSSQSADIPAPANAATSSPSPSSIHQHERGLPTQASDTTSVPVRPVMRPSQPPAAPEARFFRFRFGSTSTSQNTNPSPSFRPQSPSARGISDAALREREASHLTSASLPSLVSSSSKREEELAAELEAERVKYTKIMNEKTNLEQELEGLSQALFEEANKMVSNERIRCAEIQEELRQIREEKAALRSAMRIIEEENAFLKNPMLAPASAPADMRTLSSPPPLSTESASSEPPYYTTPVTFTHEKPDASRSGEIPTITSREFSSSSTIVPTSDSRAPNASAEAEVVYPSLGKMP